jgi:hypothetical protein
MKTKYEYHIHSDYGTEASFYAPSDAKAEDKFHSLKNLPKNVQLNLNRYDRNCDEWHHVTSSIRISNTCNA